MAHKIYLGLGSNLGERLAHLEAAVAALAPAVRVLRRSAAYETAPWGYTDQPKFLNQVLEGETDLEPKELLKFLKDKEKQLGRTERFKNGPREIDIDILLIDELVLAEDHLEVPHPNLRERAFVLVPLVEIAPDLRLPGEKLTVKEILASLDSSGVKFFQQ